MREALLAAVKADPDDDLPRLAYADWCEENGRLLYADFIRAQVAEARGRILVRRILAGPDAGPEYSEVSGSEKASSWGRLRYNEGLPWGQVTPWLSGIDGWEIRPGSTAVFCRDGLLVRLWSHGATAELFWRRGFVEQVQLPVRELAGDGVFPPLMRGHPIRGLRLHDFKPEQVGNVLLDATGGTAQLSGSVWCVGRANRDEGVHGNRVPAGVWDLLQGRDGDLTTKVYDSPDLARADVVRAALEWGRREGAK